MRNWATRSSIWVGDDCCAVAAISATTTACASRNKRGRAGLFVFQANRALLTRGQQILTKQLTVELTLQAAGGCTGRRTTLVQRHHCGCWGNMHKHGTFI